MEQAKPSIWKALLLAVLSIIVLLQITRVDAYKQWFKNRPNRYWKEFNTQRKSSATVEEVKKMRYGTEYNVAQMVKAELEKKQVKNPVILMEPNEYYKEKQIPYNAPEPVVFYYFNGMNSVWMNSKNVDSATHFLKIMPDNIDIQEIKSPEQLKEILSQYSKYTPAL